MVERSDEVVPDILSDPLLAGSMLTIDADSARPGASPLDLVLVRFLVEQSHSAGGVEPLDDIHRSLPLLMPVDAAQSGDQS